MRYRIEGFRKIEKYSTNRLMRIKRGKPAMKNRQESSFDTETRTKTKLRVRQEIMGHTES